MKLIDKLMTQSIAHTNYFKKAFINDHNVIHSDFYTLFYNYLDKNDMFKNFPIKFKASFDKEIINTLNQNTKLPNTKTDEISYYNEFFNFSYFLSLFTYMNIISLYDINTRIKIANITHDIVKNETKRLNVEINEKEIFKQTYSKIHQMIDPLQYNSFINTIFFFKSISEFHTELMRSIDKTFDMDDDLILYINRLFDDILNAYPVLNKRYIKYKKKNEKHSKINSFFVALKMRILSYLTIIRNEIYYIFTFTNSIITDPVQHYKNSLFNMNLDDSEHYRRLFSNNIENMKRAYDSFTSETLNKTFKEIYDLYGILLTKRKENIESPLLHEGELYKTIVNIEKYMDSSSKLFTSCCNTIREVKSYLYIYNKRYIQ